MFTKHAEERMRQRGFRQEHVDFIMRHGTKRRAGSAVSYSITKRIAKELSLQGFSKDLVEKCKGAYVVSTPVEGLVITVAHMH